jgi:class I fructose-bisphosphate aldolase
MPRNVPSGIGKKVRLSRILKNGRAVIFAFDHGFEHGPKDFPKEMVDPREVVRCAVDAAFDAIMLNKGIAEATWDLWAGKVPLILKVTGKTSLQPPEMQLLQYHIGYVRDAIALGADGVAGTVYWGAPQEGEMAGAYAALVGESDAVGLPTMILAYPRGPAISSQSDPEIIRYATRASAELGADLIKTHYTGSTESFREVVRVSPVPVLMSGGVKEERPLEFLRIAGSVMDAGAAGVVVGRNVFQSSDPVGLGRALRSIVHEGATPEEAEASLGKK